MVEEVIESAPFIQKRPGISRNRYNMAWRAAVAATCGPRTQPAQAPFRVYLITNKVTDKGYVGATKRPLSARWGYHLGRARDGSDSLISKAIREFGEDAFRIRILSEALNKSVAHQLETFWIRELRTFGPGYNMTETGRTGVKSQKTIAKMRAAQTARMADMQNRDILRNSRTRLQRRRAEWKGRRARRWTALLTSRLKCFYGK